MNTVGSVRQLVFRLSAHHCCYTCSALASLKLLIVMCIQVSLEDGTGNALLKGCYLEVCACIVVQRGCREAKATSWAQKLPTQICA